MSKTRRCPLCRASSVIRQDKETCQLIQTAIEERMLSLSEALKNVPYDPTEEQFEADIESLKHLSALYKIYRRFGGQLPKEDLTAQWKKAI
jgi:hypothetical protein